MRAKTGEVWADKNGVEYVVTGVDPVSDTICVAGGWVDADLSAAGWTRIAAGPDEIQARLAAAGIA